MSTPVPDRETISQPPDGRPPQDQPAWRRDFPIDWPQDQDVERRDFVKFLTLTSLAFVAGQFWIAGRSWLRRRELPAGALRIAALADVAVGGSLVFEYPAQHDTCVLVRLSDAELVAFSQKCTHLSCAVIPRPAEGVFHCPCHEGVFELRTGRVLAGPPPRPLPRIVLEVRGNDIYAVGVETRTV
jgi:nitrite reductase/ring-hydroxylating ferredoxin subunit